MTSLDPPHDTSEALPNVVLRALYDRHYVPGGTALPAPCPGCGQPWPCDALWVIAHLAADREVEDIPYRRQDGGQRARFHAFLHEFIAASADPPPAPPAASWTERFWGRWLPRRP